MKGKVLFQETQMFRFTWSWYLVIILGIPIMTLFLSGLYIQLILDQPWGDKPLSNSGLILTSILIIIIFVGVFIWIDSHLLKVQVDEGSVRYAFIPYFSEWRTLDLSKVQSLRVEKYKPMIEFGGWGKRIKWKGKAYTIHGNFGLRIRYKDGRQLMIGTQKPEELSSAIDKLMAISDRNSDG